MNWTLIAGIVVILLFTLTIAGIWVVTRDRPYRNLRAIPAFERLRRSISQSVEDGTRVHVSLGSASILTPLNASAFAGLTMLDQAAKLSVASDCPPIATSGESNLAILIQDTLHASYRAVNATALYDASLGRLSGMTPFSYAAGAMPVIRDENVSTNILTGDFGPESALLADSAEREGTFLLAGSNNLTAQAVYFAAAQEPLIGEEVFAGGAYLQAGPAHAASLHAEDFARWVLVAVLLVGSILKLAGVL